MKKHIPNLITLSNAFAGCCAVACVFAGAYPMAALFVALGLLADFLDGVLARILQVKSELGKQLDSLADMITFGVVPGAVFYQLLSAAPTTTSAAFNAFALPGFLFPVFACYRLAKFNLDTRQSLSFLGLPTPAATIFVLGLMLVAHFDSFGLRQMVLQPWLLYGCLAALSLLMVSELPMFSLKFERFQWQGNEIKFIFAAVSLALLLFLREAAPAMIIFTYVLISIGKVFTKR